MSQLPKNMEKENAGKTNPENKITAEETFFEEYEIRVSVRQLVEFILRSGDIDNRKVSGMEEAMQEGSRLHRAIQRSMGDNYSAEVLLKYRYDTGRYIIRIEGRADGIILSGWDQSKDMTLPDDLPALNQHLQREDFDEVTIDEIKCVGKNLEHLQQPEPVHLAQAKVYAYIYAAQKRLPLIRVRMTYCQFETEELKYFLYEYTYEELKSWFSKLMEDYQKWADFQYDWSMLSRSSMKKVVFPFPYREGQRNLAVYVYRSIKEKKKFYLEAPTGVGKTITTIFPAVKSMGEGLTEKIFYLTAKTITRTVAEDTFDLLRRQNLKMKTVTITAKEKCCILDKAECNPSACSRAKGHYDRINEAMYDLLIHEDRIDRDVLLQYAERYQVCPFEFSLDVSLFADAIICDYNYVFDPHASLKRYFADGSGGDYVFLIDEAHNLVERARSMYSAEIIKEDILKLKRSLKMAVEQQPLKKQLKKPTTALRLIKTLERCNKEMLELKRQCEDCIVLESADPMARLLESLYQAMNQFLEDEEGSEIRQEVLEYYFIVAHFLLIYEKLDENYCIYCEMMEDQSFQLKLLCVNPRNNLKEAMAKGRSSILFSATFLPIQYYKGLLGGEKEDYEAYAHSTFDPEKRGLFLASDVTSKYTRRNVLEYHRIAAYIYEVIQAKSGKYMVFFPSYAFMNAVYDSFSESFLEENHVECIRQEESMNEAKREEFLRYFSGETVAPDESLLPGCVNPKAKGHVPETLIGFCVLGGIFSEGIDLKQDSLIGCIIVGTGLPQICNERELLKMHFDDAQGSGFDYAYRYPGMNKVLQAAGRVIRTAEDIGVVLLLDERFLGNSYKRLFPREWSNYQVVNNGTVTQALEKFWAKWE